MARISDNTMLRTVALPAAAATADTAVVDLFADRVGPVGDALEVHFSLPALAALVEDKTVSVQLVQCATSDGTFLAIPGTGVFVVTGGSGNGAAAAQFRMYFPPDTLRYVKGRATVLADGGDNTAASLTLEFKI